ncbi:protein transporter Sec31, partial [Streptomyces gardneri]
MKPQTRTETVTRQGRAHTVVRPADPPAVPRDWDLMLLRGELALAGLLSLVTVVWSTYSIGDLLGGSWAAYGGAITFDVAWLAVQGMEWLARYQPDRRGRARRVGLALLAVSVGAITYHGHLHGALAQGAFGAGIALGAKLLWSTVLS